MKALILDCARMKIDQLNAFRAFGELHSSLYAGEAEKDLEEFAPYLFHIPDGCQTQEHFLKTGKGLSWGIMLESACPFDKLKTHLRRFLRVKMESGETMYFRFYDPRVLRVFLPTCDSHQLVDFFGPITHFIIEDEDSHYYLRFSLKNQSLIKERFTIENFNTSPHSKENGTSEKEQFPDSAQTTLSPKKDAQDSARKNAPNNPNLWID